MMSDAELLTRLEAFGTDTAGAMERFLDDTELYRLCLNSFANDKDFEALGRALEVHDYGRAFDSAHTLKGVASNLGLTSMLSAITLIVEPLRAKQPVILTREYSDLLRLRQQFRDILS